jgi:hypothetical protein
MTQNAAVPDAAIDNEGGGEAKVYILRFQVPCGLDIKKRKEKGKFTETITYSREVAIRRAIQKLRRHYRYLAFRYSIPFQGLRLIQEQDLEAIEKFTEQASVDFQKIDKGLKVKAAPIPLDLDPKRKESAALYKAVNDAVKAHIYGRVLERLQKLSKRSGDLPERSRRALLEMTKELEEWNLLGSKEIKDKLAEMTRRFALKNIASVEEDMETEVKKYTSESSWLEL